MGDDRRFYFRSDIGKANLAPPSTKATWFRLASVPLGNGSGAPTDDQDYVGVATSWTWPDALDGVTVTVFGPFKPASLPAATVKTRKPKTGPAMPSPAF